MNNKNFNRFQFSIRAPTKAQTYVHFLLEKDSLISKGDSALVDGVSNGAKYGSFISTNSICDKDSLTGWELICISSREGVFTPRKYGIPTLGSLEDTVQTYMGEVYGSPSDFAYFTFPYKYKGVICSFTLYKMPQMGEGYWELICHSGSGGIANSYTLTGLHELEKMVNDFFSILDGNEDGLPKS